MIVRPEDLHSPTDRAVSAYGEIATEVDLGVGLNIGVLPDRQPDRYVFVAENKLASIPNGNVAPECDDAVPRRGKPHRSPQLDARADRPAAQTNARAQHPDCRE